MIRADIGAVAVTSRVQGAVRSPTGAQARANASLATGIFPLTVLAFYLAIRFSSVNEFLVNSFGVVIRWKYSG